MLLSFPISNRHFLKKIKIKKKTSLERILYLKSMLCRKGDKKSPVVLKWTFSGVFSPPRYESEGEGFEA